MPTDLLKDVDFLKNELMEFYRVVHQGTEATAAMARLQAALRQVEGTGDNPALLTEHALLQRWGEVQLVFLRETIKEELRSLRVRRSRQPSTGGARSATTK